MRNSRAFLQKQSRKGRRIQRDRQQQGKQFQQYQKKIQSQPRAQKRPLCFLITTSDSYDSGLSSPDSQQQPKRDEAIGTGAHPTVSIAMISQHVGSAHYAGKPETPKHPPSGFMIHGRLLFIDENPTLSPHVRHPVSECVSHIQHCAFHRPIGGTQPTSKAFSIACIGMAPSPQAGVTCGTSTHSTPTYGQENQAFDACFADSRAAFRLLGFILTVCGTSSHADTPSAPRPRPRRASHDRVLQDRP